jgi:hypothetical protein
MHGTDSGTVDRVGSESEVPQDRKEKRKSQAGFLSSQFEKGSNAPAAGSSRAGAPSPSPLKRPPFFMPGVRKKAAAAMAATTASGNTGLFTRLAVGAAAVALFGVGFVCTGTSYERARAGLSLHVSLPTGLLLPTSLRV